MEDFCAPAFFASVLTPPSLMLASSFGGISPVTRYLSEKRTFVKNGASVRNAAIDVG